MYVNKEYQGARVYKHYQGIQVYQSFDTLIIKKGIDCKLPKMILRSCIFLILLNCRSVNVSLPITLITFRNLFYLNEGYHYGKVQC